MTNFLKRGYRHAGLDKMVASPPRFSKNKFFPRSTLVLVFIGSLLVASCGGGSSGNNLDGNIGNELISDPAYLAASKRITQAVPKLGSVTQSSNIDSVTKVTLDQVSFVFNNTTGAVTINLNRDGTIYQDTNLGGTSEGNRALHIEMEDEDDDFPFQIFGFAIHDLRAYTKPTGGHQLLDYLDINGNVVLRDYEFGGAFKEGDTPRWENPCATGTCYVMLTNRRTESVQGEPSVDDPAPLFDSSHLDYWAIGWWMNSDVNSDGSSTEVGVFAVPSLPLTTDQLASVSRPAIPITATYQGHVYGRTVEDSEEFSGNVSLVASFELTSSTIGGRVTKGDHTLTLNDAKIDFDALGGFFTGKTSYQYRQEQIQTDTGHWGGQFFGGVDSADGLPNSVTGTFAAETSPLSSTQQSVTIGAFVADKQ